MRLRRPTLGLLLAAAVAAMPRPAPGAEAAPDAPDLQVDVVLDSHEVRPGGAVGVDLWITNDSPVRAEALELRAAGTRFMHLARQAEDCGEASEAIDLGPAEGRSAVHRTLALCVGSEVVERDATLHFVLRSTWKTSGADDARASAHQVVEVPVEVRLLGVELPGVPVGLAALLIPGLLAVMILRTFGFPGVGGLDGSEKGVVGVGVSMLLVWLVAVAWPPKAAGTMSFTRFVVVCLLAALIAALLLLIHRGLLRHRRRREAARLVQPGDDERTVLRKLLALAPEFAPRSYEVTDATGTTWLGALQGTRSDGAVVLLAWFEVRTMDAKLRAELAPLFAARRLGEALRRAEEAQAEIALRDGLRRRTREGEEETALERQDFALEPTPPTVQRTEPISGKELPLVLA